jgi:hypothetical protein
MVVIMDIVTPCTLADNTNLSDKGAATLPKQRHVSAKLHGVTSQKKKAVFIFKLNPSEN